MIMQLYAIMLFFLVPIYTWISPKISQTKHFLKGISMAEIIWSIFFLFLICLQWPLLGRQPLLRTRWNAEELPLSGSLWKWLLCHYSILLREAAPNAAGGLHKRVINVTLVFDDLIFHAHKVFNSECIWVFI